MEVKDLILKYSKSGPRYTSYPTAPQWKDTVGINDFKKGLSQISEKDPISLYVHIPFCESLCYYCGCNIQITKDTGVGEPYVHSLLSELRQMSAQMKKRPPIAQISLGGGTPTFLSPQLLEQLFLGIQKEFPILPDAEISIEVDPRVTSAAHLRSLSKVGFNRISLGVQDFNEEVQKAINRIQPQKDTGEMLQLCRNLGFKGINFDLIYGLPFQTVASFEKTLKSVIEMRPDRLAVYNYAHLPQMIKHQSILDKFPMPKAEERVEIFTLAHSLLTEAGYEAIGMDHFAVATDELALASQKGKLYRNFMGYTVKGGKHLLGIGVSAISELENAYFQNIKKTLLYQNEVDHQKLASHRGMILSEDDKRRKWIIQAIMCGMTLRFKEYESIFNSNFEKTYSEELKELEPFFQEKILLKTPEGFSVTPLGRLFVRNVAMVFDAYLRNASQVFSKTV